MKHINALLFLAASVVAAPGGRDGDEDRNKACTFGTFQCTRDKTGIEICDISGRFTLVGDCPKGTACQEIQERGFDLPFCTNKDHSKDKNKDKNKDKGKDKDHDDDKDKDHDDDEDKDKDHDKGKNKDKGKKQDRDEDKNHDDKDKDKDHDDDKDKDHDDDKDKDHGKDKDGKNKDGKDKDGKDKNRKDKNRKNRPKPGDKCKTPGEYECDGRKAIQVCAVTNILRLVGNCPFGSRCKEINGIPFCVDKS